MTDHAPNILVLQASVDPEALSEFRILVDNKFVKYITIDAGVYDRDDMCFGPSLISLLPHLPPGDWKKGHISRNLKTGDAHFSALREEKKLRSNVYEVTCPGFSSTIIAKFARFEWEVTQLEAETMAYGWIEGQHVGPGFLGHLTEEGRVIGFLIARIADCRHATPEDFPLCHSVLSKLHKLGIKHGDINKHNFLIHDGKATLIDFDKALRPASNDELDVELYELQDQFQDTSGRGGQVVESDPC
ncbi:alpha-galactosidase A precursor [Pseudomassariella vexata]|uniref:Alpha-galactosidase A n=1 Tax=Pseudomassariella vexata TaxID=1141098 RepID=A0A1Y2E8E1_9PEZI|nr:alpha-galactosidase A precursor [Pseudomassariella vexata]ORY67833.1 alpha-galactosidase A precursor [Pseudomassariella vexata]